MRYELTEYEWAAVKPSCRTSRVLMIGRAQRYPLGPAFDTGRLWPVHHLLQSLHSLGERLKVWDEIMNALTGDNDAAVQMIDTSIVRVHQYGACIAGNSEQLMGRSRGGLTTKIHAVVDTHGLPVRLALSAAARAGPSKTANTGAC